jgi:hypothetical protein
MLCVKEGRKGMESQTCLRTFSLLIIIPIFTILTCLVLLRNSHSSSCGVYIEIWTCAIFWPSLVGPGFRVYHALCHSNDCMLCCRSICHLIHSHVFPGYEKDMYKLKNDKQAMEQEAYLWSVADMWAPLPLFQEHVCRIWYISTTWGSVFEVLQCARKEARPCECFFFKHMMRWVRSPVGDSAMAEASDRRSLCCVLP